MGVGSRGPWSPWIFIHGANIVDGGLKVLFFGLFFVAPPGIFLPTPLGAGQIKWRFGGFDLLSMKGSPPTLEMYYCHVIYFI